jgi:hypothetical protein
MKFHANNSRRRRDEVFVFESNLAGTHDMGEAKHAIKYGAKYGRGVGVQGNTYAIPTKDHGLAPMPLNQIQPYIARFVRFTNEHPQVKFFITHVGGGSTRCKDSEIAPLFKGCSDECSFPEQWEMYLKD